MKLRDVLVTEEKATKYKGWKKMPNGKTLRIVRDTEWDEWQVEVKGNADATYYTDDEQDAIDTYKEMGK